MLKSSAAAVSSFAKKSGPGDDQADDDSSCGLAAIGRDDDTKSGNPDTSAKKRKEKVPEDARLWGFIRDLDVGETLNAQASKSVKMAENDVTLWWDSERYRFLIAAEKLVIDELSPLQFVHFVRQLRDVTNRVLFKYERHHDGSIGRVYRIWSARA
jgi:hypothetical protein